MRTYGTLVRRELGTYFISWTGYVVMMVVLGIIGTGFMLVLQELNGKSSPVPITELFTFFFWIVIIPACPVITMRLFSQEKSSGTFETLMTAPVSDAQVVAAKFSAAFIFYLLIWLPLMIGVYALRPYLVDPSALDTRLILSTYIGIASVGSVFIAVGTFASALSRSQVNAAIIAFGLGILFTMLGVLALYPPSIGSWSAEFFNYVSVLTHMQDFSRGMVDTRPLVFDLSVALLFLYLTLKVIESRRWK